MTVRTIGDPRNLARPAVSYSRLYEHGRAQKRAVALLDGPWLAIRIYRGRDGQDLSYVGEVSRDSR